ncbi:MAG: DUF1343 domain-containing protein [Bacteroidetes bacterium]|nr:DUF1343 domain-containing protein [Bacteroidota bacterium]
MEVEIIITDKLSVIAIRAIITINREKDLGSLRIILRAMNNSNRIQTTTTIFTTLTCIMYTFIFCIIACLNYGCKNSNSATEANLVFAEKEIAFFDTDIITGADQTELYLPLLIDKKIAVVVNQTSMINNTHLVDSLIKRSIQVQKIFAPEHGFRGDHDDGASVQNGKDVSTGIPIISLYGTNKKPTAEQLKNIDYVIFDIQDVGTRFYTFLSTMHYVMEACAENNIPLLVLDRPNPNGFYVDGPVLKKEFNSFVGMHPIPVVHGMTFGELAQMINAEAWLANGVHCDLKIISCKNYDHTSLYKLPINPSPNLRSMESIYLYPSLCFFEGTNVSVGRGTANPFQIFGSPYYPATDFSFIPESSFGSSSPPFKGEHCNGFDLTKNSNTALIQQKLSLQYLLQMYAGFTNKEKFFLTSGYFNKLAGTDELRIQIEAGLTEEEIRLSWQNDLVAFKQMRKKYLLYPDFE